ncbi:Hypothetical predicted protein [Marmota monax]|uniref:Uncharacterized protein n=1 Tax=Marmota monax TaxID=9995 RepID=A0A5E4D354_MARMO|nr:Hypothetical predicted protein [Marmota monax]
MVPKGQSVTLWCWGTREAEEYRLHFEGGVAALKRPRPPGLVDKVKFFIPTMASSTAGQYHCFYRRGELWSEPSSSLDLVVTGYPVPKPELIFQLEHGQQLWTVMIDLFQSTCPGTPVPSHST